MMMIGERMVVKPCMLCGQSPLVNNQERAKYRALIEKQEEIIKEMRGIIRRYVKLDTKCEVQDNLNHNATSVLEKTKDYAE